MKKIELMAASPEIVSNVVRNSRDEDRDNVAEVILDAIKHSDRSWAAMIDGEVACVWGVTNVNILLQHVYIWMHLTKTGEDNGIRFLRKSKEFIDSLAGEYRLIYGHLDPRKTPTKRWLQWLGFTFGPVQEFRDKQGSVHLAEVFTRGEH